LIVIPEFLRARSEWKVELSSFLWHNKNLKMNYFFLENPMKY